MPIPVNVIDKNLWVTQKSEYRKKVDTELEKLLYKGLLSTSTFIVKNSAKDGDAGLRKETILGMLKKSIEIKLKIEINNLTQEQIDTLFDVVSIINKSFMKTLHQKYLDVKNNRVEEEKKEVVKSDMISAVEAIQELKKLGIKIDKQTINNHRNSGRVTLKKIGGRNYIEKPIYERYKNSFIEEQEEE